MQIRILFAQNFSLEQQTNVYIFKESEYDRSFIHGSSFISTEVKRIKIPNIRILFHISKVFWIYSKAIFIVMVQFVML